jgi:nucleoside-diphosphate kinase
MLERTLLNIKPDAVKRNLIGEIIRRVEKNNYRIVSMYMIHLTKKECEAFYAAHREQPFFDKLIDLMISGPCVPIVIEGENVINGIRELIGATDPAEAEEGTIRKDFAENVTINCVHASDGLESAMKEIEFFFSKKLLLS